jgi:hypothetical protein
LLFEAGVHLLNQRRATLKVVAGCASRHSGTLCGGREIDRSFATFGHQFHGCGKQLFASDAPVCAFGTGGRCRVRAQAILQLLVIRA